MHLAEADVVGVTTAHSVSIGDAGRPVERIALSVAGQAGHAHAAEFDTLRGAPGQPFADDLSVDYVLLHVREPVDPALVLAADPRGGPQPGERVALFSGLVDGQGGRRVLGGTVQSAGQTAAWVLLDEETFNPALMSGSPFVSQHAGKVVGMAVVSSVPATLPGAVGNAPHRIDLAVGYIGRRVSQDQRMAEIAVSVGVTIPAQDWVESSKGVPDE